MCDCRAPVSEHGTHVSGQVLRSCPGEQLDILEVETLPCDAERRGQDLREEQTVPFYKVIAISLSVYAIGQEISTPSPLGTTRRLPTDLC